MGKMKNKKHFRKSSNPSGIPSLKEMNEESETLMPEKIDSGTFDSILEKLQSRRAEDRECAAVIIANMANNKEFIGTLIEKKVVRVAAPLLIDKKLAVRHAIAGCLRNVAACEDYMISEAMVEQDIMTSLVALLEQYRESWTPVSSKENKIDSKSEIFVEVCNLLWSLCENSDLAVSIFNKRDLISILLPCLNVDVYGLDIPLTVAQCLYTIGENNTHLNETMRQPLVEQQLNTLMNLSPVGTEQILLRSLAAGMKLNIFAGKLNNCMSDVTSSILNVISSTFEKPIHFIADLLAKQISSHKAEKNNKDYEEKNLEEKLNDVNTTYERFMQLLSAKQMCLEMLGNMFDDGDDSDNEEWEDVSSNEDCDSILETIDDMDVDETDVSATELGLGLSSEIYSIAVTGNMVQKILEQMVMPSEEVQQVLAGHSKAKNCMKRVNSVRATALLCLNNVIQKLNVEDLGGPQRLLDLWVNLANNLFKKTDLTDTEQVEAITRSMSAIIRKLAEDKCSSHFSNMTESDVEMLMDICRQSQDSQIKVHVIRILGTIGCLLGALESPTSVHLIKVIGSFLLEICTKSVDMWVTAEVLDVIFDMFAEDNTDYLAKELCLVDKLVQILPEMKRKIKQQKRSLGIHLPVIMTANENLLRFIKYKREYDKK